MVIFFRLLHPANAYSLIVVILSGSMILVKFSQHLNANSPIVVKPFGSVILVSASPPQKTLSPILVTPSGRVMSPEKSLLFGIMLILLS